MTNPSQRPHATSDDCHAQRPISDRFSLNEIRQTLSSRGSNFWRSLEELAETEDFQEWLQEELPRQSMAVSTNRRDFLKLMGAALAMVGLSGCTEEPQEEIVPYVRQPEQIVPGRPLFFASAMQLSGYARGVLVESHEGRPTKLEGNPDHPASLGATDPFAQGAIFSLYDPDRAEVVSRAGQISTWDEFEQTLTRRMDSENQSGGAGLRLLTGTVTSPTLDRQIRSLLQAYPEARWHHWEPINYDNSLQGTELVFGQAVQPVYNFERAQRIVSLDADLLFDEPGSLHYARDFANKRRVWRDEESASTDSASTDSASTDDGEMNRLYSIGPTPTLTSAKADHHLALPAREVEAFARALGQSLGLERLDAPTFQQSNTEQTSRWLDAIAGDLMEHNGSSLVVPGMGQPPAVHAIAHAINLHLQNVGETVDYIEPVTVEPESRSSDRQIQYQQQSLAELVADMESGNVDTLVILGTNPVYSAPADLDFASGMEQVEFSIHHSLYFDETSALCDWHVPGVHFLEAWSDARAYDGTASVVQPLIAPLFQGRTEHQMLAALLGDTQASTLELVQETWLSYFESESTGETTFSTFWQQILHDGVVTGTAAPAIEVTVAEDWQQDALSPSNVETSEPASVENAELEIVFRPDPSLWDGQFSNNAWLQELPKPITTLTWDNAALLSPATAEKFNLQNEDVVRLRLRHEATSSSEPEESVSADAERAIQAAVLILPGHADNSVTLHLGYGRTWQAEISQGIGFNAYQLRTTNNLWSARGLQIERTEQVYPLALTQNHHVMEERNLVRSAPLQEYLEHPDFAQEHHGEGEDGEVPSLYPEYEYDGYKWGMVIDLNACIGCNACVIGCQTENNIPIVGKEGVMNGREMHWLLVDHYFEGDPAAPNNYFQPRPCMHCETAPCEPVCPVEATVHGDEGLNQMIYNRCVGTRYCSNNCPYKVRRFNFLNYVESEEIPLLNLWRNPDVTVRSRGVMEKCTYCIQRIKSARIEAEEQDRPIQDGEVLTACQSACPTRAIKFGDLNDENAEVNQLNQNPLNYGLLEELGTKPRTTYMAAVTNPNPALAEGD